MNVKVRFEREVGLGKEGSSDLEFGPYEWVQLTYELLRTSQDSGDHELAIFCEGEEIDDGFRSTDNWWSVTDHEGQERKFSDVVIFGVT